MEGFAAEATRELLAVRGDVALKLHFCSKCFSTEDTLPELESCNTKNKLIIVQDQFSHQYYHLINSVQTSSLHCLSLTVFFVCFVFFGFVGFLWLMSTFSLLFYALLYIL